MVQKRFEGRGDRIVSFRIDTDDKDIVSRLYGSFVRDDFSGGSIDDISGSHGRRTEAVMERVIQIEI